MKIAIHIRPGSFSDKWVEYCNLNQIEYKAVNCFDSDIIRQLKDCHGLMWHWPQWDSRAILFARQLTYALEYSGVRVFPDSRTCWHYDDKVGQKYLFEALNLPFVNSQVFYDKRDALKWAEKTNFPKVFKLRGGAGSVNVKLVKNKRQCKKYIKTAFGRGFRSIDRTNSIQDRFLKLNRERSIHAAIHVLKGVVRLVVPRYDDVMRTREKGYIYFQDYIPDNFYDIRVIVIGKRAIAIKRMIRKNDFRASGSGNIVYTRGEIPMICIKAAFKCAEKLDMQSVAFDFVFDRDDQNPFLLEISYAFSSEAYYNCPGFWDKKLNWHECEITPELFLIEDFLQQFRFN